jgi:hypothetical protein
MERYRARRNEMFTQSMPDFACQNGRRQFGIFCQNQLPLSNLAALARAECSAPAYSGQLFAPLAVGLQHLNDRVTSARLFGLVNIAEARLP